MYSEEIENFEVWSDNDKTDYIKAMKLEFNKFFGTEGEEI